MAGFVPDCHFQKAIQPHEFTVGARLNWVMSIGARIGGLRCCTVDTLNHARRQECFGSAQGRESGRNRASKPAKNCHFFTGSSAISVVIETSLTAQRITRKRAFLNHAFLPSVHMAGGTKRCTLSEKRHRLIRVPRATCPIRIEDGRSRQRKPRRARYVSVTHCRCHVRMSGGRHTELLGNLDVSTLRTAGRSRWRRESKSRTCDYRARNEIRKVAWVE